MGCWKRSKEFIRVTQHSFYIQSRQYESLVFNSLSYQCGKKKGCVCARVCGGLSMFTKPVKVPMREQWNLPLFSRDSLAVMIHLLTHQNRNRFLSSPFMPYERSVRYISLVLKYCYLETRCWAAALSLFDKLNFIVNCGNLLYASCLVLSLGSGYSRDNCAIP